MNVTIGKNRVLCFGSDPTLPNNLKNLSLIMKNL